MKETRRIEVDKKDLEGKEDDEKEMERKEEEEYRRREEEEEIQMRELEREMEEDERVRLFKEVSVLSASERQLVVETESDIVGQSESEGQSVGQGETDNEHDTSGKSGIAGTNEAVVMVINVDKDEGKESNENLSDNNYVVDRSTEVATALVSLSLVIK